MVLQGLAVGLAVQIRREASNRIQELDGNRGVAGSVDADLLERCPRDFIEGQCRDEHPYAVLFITPFGGRELAPDDPAQRRAQPVDAGHGRKRLVDAGRKRVGRDLHQLLDRIQRVLVRGAMVAQTKALAQTALDFISDAPGRQRSQERGVAPHEFTRALFEFDLQVVPGGKIHQRFLVLALQVTIFTRIHRPGARPVHRLRRGTHGRYLPPPARERTWRASPGNSRRLPR